MQLTQEHRLAYLRYRRVPIGERREAVLAALDIDRFFLIAADSCDMNAMALALDCGANLNVVHPDFEVNALPLAACSTISRMRQIAVWFLLDRGIDVNPPSACHTALHAVCRYMDSPSMIRVLVEGGVPIDARDESGDTPLHSVLCCFGGNPARQLLRLGADVHARNHLDQTPLHTATRIIIEENVPAIADLCRVLIEAGADPWATDQEGRTPFRNIAAWPDLLRIFLPYPLRNKGDRSP